MRKAQLSDQQPALLVVAVPPALVHIPERAISMTRVEIVVFAEKDEVPACILQAFESVQWIDAGGSNGLAIFACDLSRQLRDKEDEALSDAEFHGDIVCSRILTR